MKIGDAAEVSRAFSAEDVAAYVRLGGAAAEGDALPEPLVGALYSYLLGAKLPGFGTMYLKQDSQYFAAASIGSTLTARVEVTRLRPDKFLVDLATSCHAEDGTRIEAGRALVYAKHVAGAFD